MKNLTRGFTIVELLIVIVVIAILASITIVSYNGVRDRADTTARLSELKAWEKQYQLYAASYGRYPTYPGAPDGDSTGADTGYCLGTGYPNLDDSGRGNCRDLPGGFYRHFVNSTLNSELAKVGSLPSGPRTQPSTDGALGVFAHFYSGGNVVLTNAFKGSSCPGGTRLAYPYPSGRTVLCSVDLPSLN